MNEFTIYLKVTNTGEKLAQVFPLFFLLFRREIVVRREIVTNFAVGEKFFNVS